MSQVIAFYVLLLATAFSLGCSPKPAQDMSQEIASKWEGKLIKSSGNAPDDAKLYIVRDGKKHWIVSPAALISQGLGGRDAEMITRSELDLIPTGEKIQ